MSVLRSILTLGIVGFLCGFVGPMLLAPGANQGPLMGIFITGPGGALLGAGLALAGRVLSWSPATHSSILRWVSIGLAVSVLYLCVPSPRYRADVVEGQLRSCTDPASLRDAAAARLNGIEATRANAQPGQWGERVDRALAERPGVVIDVHVLRLRQVFEKQAAWNRGELTAKPWAATDRNVAYFTDSPALACATSPAGTRVKLAVRGGTGIWPPQGIAEILDLREAEPAEVHYPAFAMDR